MLMLTRCAVLACALVCLGATVELSEPDPFTDERSLTANVKVRTQSRESVFGLFIQFYCLSPSAFTAAFGMTAGRMGDHTISYRFDDEPAARFEALEVAEDVVVAALGQPDANVLLGSMMRHERLIAKHGVEPIHTVDLALERPGLNEFRRRCASFGPRATDLAEDP